MLNINSHARYVMLPFYGLSIIGFFILKPWDYLAVYLLWFLISVVGINITMHRHLSHGAFEFRNSWLRRFCLFLGCSSIQAPPEYWIIQHNHHHRTADTEDDLHTPKKGFLTSFFMWQLQPEMQVESTLGEKRLLARSKEGRKFGKYYRWIVWSLFTGSALINIRYGFIFAMASTLSSFEVGLVNYFCHSKKYGYRVHDTKDDSVNNKFLNYFVFGAGLHHNHHARARDYDLSDAYSIDLSGKLIHYLLKK